MDWRDIPGNLAAFERLVELVRSGEAIGFVGAGASAPLYPLWGRFIEHLADRAVATRCADARQRDYWCRKAGERPDQIAKQIRKVLDQGDFNQTIRELFGPKPTTTGESFTPTHRALVRLPFQGFLTTNYDPCLEEACARLYTDRRAVPFTWKDDRVVLWQREAAPDLRERPILHAHGRFDQADSIVLGIDEYRDVYGSAHPYLDLLGHLFTRQTLVFVGFSFADRWLTSFADRALTHSGARELLGARHVAIVGLPTADMGDADLLEADLREALRAHVLFYPVENGNYSALLEILGELQRLLPKAGDPPPRHPTPSSAALLAAWFDHVAAEHRRLSDFLDRPGRLDLIEHAWVEVQMQADPVALEQAEIGPSAADATERSAHGKARFGQQLTLEEAVALSPADGPWITGNWLLEGLPGSGKTTLLRHFAHSLALERDPGRIPVFLPLPRIVDSERSWLAVATDGFPSFGAGKIAAELERAGAEGRLLLLLDGLDEVPPDRRKAVDRLLRNLHATWPACRAVLSTRPLGRGELPEGFPRLGLLPLQVERQRDFLVKWFTEAGQAPVVATATAGKALGCFQADRNLRDLAGNPLYLTLLALLWQQDGRPPERLAFLYDRIFELLLSGQHRPEGKPIPAQEDVREALAHLAYGMTVADCWAESPAQLERRLRDRGLDKIRHRLETVAAWKDNLRRFLDDVHEQTQILGPHDGQRQAWRFWHRTFREALTAERLRALHGEGDADALAAWAGSLTDASTPSGGEGRWAEPLAILAGRLQEPDALVRRLAEANPRLALRSMAFTQGLKVETLLHTLQLAEDLEARAKVFHEMPDQLDDPRACLALVEQLKANRPGGFDYFWLGWVLVQVADRWPGYTKASQEALRHLFELIPPPNDLELFRSVETPLDGRVPLWRTIPVGIGWIGSPKGLGAEDEHPQHRVKIVRPFALAAVPVTNVQYAAFDPSKAAKDKPLHPVVNVTWYEAASFCRWLSSQVPRCANARLPTEEEWEYACRARSETTYWSGNQEAHLAEVGWYNKNSESRTHEVGEKLANGWGLYDVHGNVWEWTASVWDGGKYKKRAWKEPFGLNPAKAPADLAAPPGGRRVLRGGCFWDEEGRARSAYRIAWYPATESGDLGFRVMLSSAPSDD